MPFTCDRTIHFRDTDAAGVVYFANILAICHEAYEASLIAAGIDLKTFFRNSEVAIPITHVSADFYGPMYCGDRIVIQLLPERLSDRAFAVHYTIHAMTAIEREEETRPLGKAIARHVCINPKDRSRQNLPHNMEEWLQKFGGSAREAH